MTPTGRARFTQRGWTMLVLSLCLVIGATLFGIQELYPIAAGAFVLPLLARAWVATKRWEVRVARHVRPSRVPAGSSARVELAVHNFGRSRSPLLAARDPFENGRRWARFLISPLVPGEERLAAYSLPTTQRGVFKLGPLELQLTDPFGLATTAVTASGTSTLTVHPRVEPIRSRYIPAEPDPDTRVALPIIGRVGDEFYGLREYRPGDDLRRVHWVSTARVDEVMIRQPENLLQGRLTVGVDLRSEMHDSASLEASLSAAASIVTAALGTRIHVRLVTTSGTDTGFGSTAAHCAAAMDILAAAQTHRGSSLTSDLMLGSDPGPLALVTTQSIRSGDLAAVTRTSGRNTITVVVFERPGSPVLPAGFDRRCRYVPVRTGGSFRAAWEGAQC